MKMEDDLIFCENFVVFFLFSNILRSSFIRGGRVLDISKIQLTQPSLVELGLRLSLAKIKTTRKEFKGP